MGGGDLSLEDHLTLETLFVDNDVFKNVLKLKDSLALYNPRKIKLFSQNNLKNSQGFMNRGALKMKEIDEMTNYLFTRDGDVKFADICSGPGGFTEYILYKTENSKSNVRGWGFTLRNELDFKLEKSKMFKNPKTMKKFTPHYGLGDGNIMNPENIINFKTFVLQECLGGVDYILADGGFDVSNRENEQEILSVKLYLCEIILGLGILKLGGHFLLKVFDIYTPFSFSLMYLLSQSFESFSILKPNSSRMTNSERYILCKNKLDVALDVESFLLKFLIDNASCENLSNFSLNFKKINYFPLFKFISDLNLCFKQKEALEGLILKLNTKNKKCFAK